MPTIGPGHDDPEYDNYDPAWENQDTPFRRWLDEQLRQAGRRPDEAAFFASCWAPINRYHGLDDIEIANIATLTRTTTRDVQTAHKNDLAEWAREQQLRSHPELAVLDAHLDHIANPH
jgi:hypothetical protein